jgi:ADP-heptose:LPS heptosyltransferase
MLQKNITKIQPSSIGIYVGLDFVGDGLIKLPFIRSLRQVFPSAKITWIAGTHKSEFKRTLAPLVKGLLDEVIEECNIGFIGVSEAKTSQRLNDLKNFIKSPLQGKKFDLLIDTQTHFLTTLLVKTIRHKYFLSGCANFYLSDLKPSPNFKRELNLSQRLVQLSEIALGKRINVPPPPLPLEDKYRDLAKQALPKNNNYIGFAPGAGDTTKCWKLENFIDVAKYFSQKKRIPVFFLGPKEKRWLQIIKKYVPGSLFPEWGKFKKKGITGPAFVIALSERIRCALANDSGTAHMIDAGGAPIVKVFGRSLPGKYTGLTPGSITIDSRIFGSSDINKITPKYVIKKIEDFF